MSDFDLVVIGSGPAGESGATEAAAAGKRVAVVERRAVLGGTAANTGTLPSKMLRETALYLSGYRQRGLYGVETVLRREATIADLLYRERLVQEGERQRICANLEQHGVELALGSATFEDAHTLRVERPGAAPLRLTARCFLVATGSSPHRPPPFPPEDPRVHDSDELLDMLDMPPSLLVAGGGVIGCEYACMFAALGLPVTLVDPRPALLPFLDEEMAALLTARMQTLGVRLWLGRSVASLEAPAAPERPLRLTLSGGEGVEAHAVLVATGRVGNTAGLGLEALGVKLGAHGHVEVGPHYQTALPHIYAAGDVVGFPALASTSMEQARLAVRHAFGLSTPWALPRVLPIALYTIPELSQAGDTEEALRARGVAYVAGRAPFATNPRGRLVGDTQGLLKLLFRADDQRLLGVHVIGEQAAELVHVGLTALVTGAGARLFLETCFNYPTLSEAYRHATHDALRRLRAGALG